MIYKLSGDDERGYWTCYGRDFPFTLQTPSVTFESSVSPEVDEKEG